MSSIKLTNQHDPVTDDESLSDSESELDNDDGGSDWVSDSHLVECKSLFDDEKFPTVESALNHDKQAHGFDLLEVFRRLGLDFHGRIRYINYVRGKKPRPDVAGNLRSEDFSDDVYLRPILEDDPLLQYDFDGWSDGEDEDSPSQDPLKQIDALKRKLALSQHAFEEYRSMLMEQRFGDANLASDAGKPFRDDDSHYFDSYSSNDIHAIMIQDKVRTSSYAEFILGNPTLFQDAIVLDVGCGTGILSLFAAKAGAKCVFAVDASDIAAKAEKIVKANGLDNIITVVRGKVEEIKLPDGFDKVDIIVSEWMGYALLYESMLDSVLKTRDRFLRPGGVMAPSQSRMMLALCDGNEIMKEYVSFWDDVYGFDLSEMTDGIYDDAIIDVVGPESLLSPPAIVKDLLLSSISTKALDFSSTFTLVSDAPRKTKVHAFVLYFDTFFNPSGDEVPETTKVKMVKEGEANLAEVWPVGGRTAPQRRASQKGRHHTEGSHPKIVSFSTSPKSMPTHWKQTIFLLKEPFFVTEGAIVEGTLSCRKSTTNSRELDVDITYSIRSADNVVEVEVEAITQSFEVR